MLNDISSPIALLTTRRSAKARAMIAPGPESAQHGQILAAAARTPDHGKLGPWRFVVVGADHRVALADLLHSALSAEKPDAPQAEHDAMDQFAHQAPSLVVVLSAPVTTSPVPLWEQQLSAGAACMNLLAATHALGFTGCWLTGWAAYSDRVRAALGGPEGSRIAGFLFLGTPGKPLEERPRPDLADVVSHWAP